MFLKNFFRPTKPSSPRPPKEWLNERLNVSGLNEFIPQLVREKTQSTAKVFYNTRYFTSTNPGAPFSLGRALCKIPAINVAGDREGVFPNGTPFPPSPEFFEKIPLHHPELLSPIERLSAAKKIIYSNSSVFAVGGYPAMNPRIIKKDPFEVGIFSLAGASFENHYLHYSLFMLDAVNPKNKNPMFDHLFENLPSDFKEAQTSLGTYDSDGSITRIRTGFPLLARSESGKFYSSFSKKNAVIFLGEAYYRHQLEDISMLLASVNEAAKESGKPALLKATAVGMGFFAKVDGQYDIQYLLYPRFLRAFQKLLQDNSYPWIAKIEFPTFGEQVQAQFDLIMDEPFEHVEVYRQNRDVLEFTEEETQNYYVCAINPSDAFSYAGNEWSFGSVEAMIGLNSSLRFDQIPLANPPLLDSDHHIPVKINSNFGAELGEIKSGKLQMNL
ncbi:type IV secretion protein Dot [Legionella sp. WA2022007384]